MTTGPNFRDHLFAESLNNFASLPEATERYAEAGPLYREALAVLRAALGAEHPTTQTARENLRRFLAGRAD